MRLPPVLRQPTLWLVLAPVLALVAVVGATRLGSGSPAEERAARTATTTTSTPSTSTTAPGEEAVTPPSAPADGSGSAAAEVLGVQEDSGFSEGESLAGVGFDDGGSTEVLGEQFVALDLTTPPPDPVTPPTTTPLPVPTTVPTTTTGPSTTAQSTTTTTTPLPSVQAQSRTVLVQMSCTVFDPAPGAVQPPAVAVPVTVGVSTLTAVPAGRGLPVLVGLLGPTNLLGEVPREQLVQSVRISAPGSGSTPLQLSTANPLPLAAGAVVPIPDGGDDFLAGTFSVSAAAGTSVTVQVDSVSFSRLVDGRTLEQRCDVVPGTPAQLATVAVVSESTPTTTIALPDPVVPESPFTALLPISAVVVGGAALALLVRRRRSVTTSVDHGGS